MGTSVRQLPGLRFEAQPPPAAQILPRMDVAGFVGFASAGPIDVPVPVEDPQQFAAVFGPDPPLAWDADRGEQGYAYLGPAVRSFFRNGGRRCWVVRVAQLPDASPPDADGVTNRFPLSGVAQRQPDGSLSQGLLIARSPGSWADALTVATSLELTPVRLGQLTVAPEFSCEAFVAAPDEIVAGDLIRLELPSAPGALLFVVSAVDAAPGEPLIVEGTLLHRILLASDTQLWLEPLPNPGWPPGIVEYPASGVGTATVAATLTGGAGEGLIALELAVPASSAPPPGSLLHGRFGAEDAWISVDELTAADTAATLVHGTAFAVSPLPSASPPWGSEAPLGAKLELTLRVDGDPNGQLVLGGLGFAPAHPRFIGALPTDAALYGEPPQAPGDLAADALNPRFSLAGPAEAPQLYVPLAMSILGEPALPPVIPAGSERARDGLETFDLWVFLDPDLAGADVPVLLQEAAWIRDQAPAPRPLRGIHALLSVDEVTIIAVPDAVQRGWQSSDEADTSSSEPSLEPPPTPDWAQFLACRTAVLAPPDLILNAEPEAGTFSLTWTPADAPDARYELQQATLLDMSDALTVFEGEQREFSLYGGPAGATLRFRVRATSDGNVSGWSQTLVVALPSPQRWTTVPDEQYSSAGLLVTQLALLRMCAARGDILALLSLPGQLHTRAAAAHVSALKAGAGPAGGPADPIFSYGAAFHPWIYATDPSAPGTARATPPDGALAGIIAARAAAPGPWIAPANVPLRDALALEPVLGPDAPRPMLDAQVNLVRQDPRGFLCLTADTLSETDDLRPIGVRRLLAALRRLALLQGTAYVFEPNSDAFARGVQRDIDQVLTRLWSLGAFAGATPSESFRVTTTGQSDAGALLVEIAVAPSLPLAFLTVRLMRGPNGALSVQGA